MKSKAELKNIIGFAGDYASRLLGSGVHTSRVVRNTKRIGDSLDVDVTMTVFPKTIIVTVYDRESTGTITEVVDIPTLRVDFEYNSELSSLSWEAYDKRLSPEALRERYEAILAQPKMSTHLVMLLTGLANASFCHLFGGAAEAAATVFVATLAGFCARHRMQKRKINHFIVVTLSAFLSSACTATTLLFSSTAEAAIATGVLYLMPGVLLINGVIDILEGHTLTGCARLIQAFLTVICIAAGLSLPLLFINDNLL